MSALAFCCPVTSQVLQCDFELDAQTLRKLNPTAAVHVQCPHCHLKHRCVIEDALVLDGERAGWSRDSRSLDESTGKGTVFRSAWPLATSDSEH